MATDPIIMKLRLAAINRIISAIPVKPDTSYYLDEREIGENVGEALLASKIRNELNNLPRGYNKPEPSLSTQAKTRFLQWRENQAKGEWKTLTEAEQAVWEGYVSEGVEFGTIRERELAREAPFEVGDRVVLHHNIGYLGKHYPAGSAGEIKRVVLDPIKEEQGYMVWFDDQNLVNINAYAHELRRA